MDIAKLIKPYLESKTTDTPFFLFVSDLHYNAIKDRLAFLELRQINLSSYCSDTDKRPDLDAMRSYLASAHSDTGANNLVLLGLGEYLAMLDVGKRAINLSMLKDLPLGGVRVVVLLRGIRDQIESLKSDPRFDDRRYCVIDDARSELSFTPVDPSVKIPALQGIRTLLQQYENGEMTCGIVSTVHNFDGSSIANPRIRNPYDGISSFIGRFPLPRTMGSDEHWGALLADLNDHKGLIDGVFENHGLTGNLAEDFYSHASGGDYRHWLYFIALKLKATSLANGYLQHVVNITECFSDLKKNVLVTLSNLERSDKRFTKFYDERKKLIKGFKEPEIVDFIVDNRRIVSESVYRLTDVFPKEREEIIAWVSRHGFVEEIAKIYPALWAYKQKFFFDGSAIDALLTDYFHRYKEQKISNKLDDDFLAQVDELAMPPRKFMGLQPRDGILDMEDRDGTYLYWLDALGVEYLAFIKHLAREAGLSISIQIARAELPTITSLNDGFFKAWPEGQRKSNKDLDSVIHKDSGGFNFNTEKLPIHLAEQLRIIASVIDEAAKLLSSGNYKRFLIASDHGASRLAVLRGKEEKYDVGSKGEHSGRCCPIPDEPLELQLVLPFASTENGHLVLADYGRFKGGRMASVEVHGGASLEEAVVPVIELRRKDGAIEVSLVRDEVIADVRKGTEIELFINAQLKNVYIVLDEVKYDAEALDTNHYKVALPDLKRAGEYEARVYEGANLVGNVTIKTRGKSGKVNSGFNDLF